MEGQSNIAAHLHTAANVQVLDDTHSLFGELYTPEQIWSALWDSDNNNNNEDPNVGSPTIENATASNNNNNLLRSQDFPRTTFLNAQYETVTPHEIAIEIHNTTTDWTVRVRWINSTGNNNPSRFLWNVSPSSTFEQYTTPGHLFVLSVVRQSDETNDDDDDDDNSNNELILGAYRPKRALPSSTPHCVLVHGGGATGESIHDDNDEEADTAVEETETTVPPLFLLETLLLDESKFDALSVAASELDRYHDKQKNDRSAAHRTVQMLQKIIQNAIRHPDDERYHKLRLSNPKIQQFIASSPWGALELLRICGFVEHTVLAGNDNDDKDDDKNEEEATALETFLILPTPTTDTANRIGERALDLLRILDTRLAPGFIPDIAPPTPWQEMGVSVGSTTRSNWNNNNNNTNNRRGFITDEERWARAERAASMRRSGGSRRPAPGEAPSSRGKWGR